MRRKLVRVGGSLAVTLPAEIVKEFALEPGHEVDLALHPTTGAITIRPGVREFDGGKVTGRYRRAIGTLLDRRAELYRRLAK